MGRHTEDSEAYIIAQLGIVTACIVDHRRKTWQELRDVAYRWCIKDYVHAKDTAETWGVAPIYLVHAALLYVEHPLLVADGLRWKYGIVRMQAEIMRVMVGRLDVDIPVKIQSTNCDHSHVDAIRQTVERMELSTKNAFVSTEN